MSEPLTTQTSFIYLAQFVLGLGIALMLRLFSRINPKIYLPTWSLSAFFFCIHALSYSFLTSSLTNNIWLHLLASLSSAVFNNLHIVLMFIGAYEALRRKSINKKQYQVLLAIPIGLGIITTSIFASAPSDSVVRNLISIGWLELITGISFVISGTILTVTRVLRWIGVKIVGICFFFYGATHLFKLSIVIRTTMGEKISLPPIFGLIEIVLIALLGFGLVIWLLEDEREQLRRTNKELDSFIYSTSHDLRAPIASVLGLINVARHEIKESISLEFMNLIEGRIKKLDEVIGDILRLSRVKKNELRYEMIDFNSLMADCMSDLKFIESYKGITLKYRESPSNRFYGDYNLTKMVLNNLLSNAIKYHCLTKPDPYIEVQFNRTRGQASFVVADNGEGIADEHQGKVFDMFYRASSNSQGTGLGLYIVKETLARIGGSVEMESKVGVGTKFKIILDQPM